MPPEPEREREISPEELEEPPVVAETASAKIASREAVEELVTVPETACSVPPASTVRLADAPEVEPEVAERGIARSRGPLADELAATVAVTGIARDAFREVADEPEVVAVTGSPKETLAPAVVVAAAVPETCTSPSTVATPEAPEVAATVPSSA